MKENNSIGYSHLKERDNDKIINASYNLKHILTSVAEYLINNSGKNDLKMVYL